MGVVQTIARAAAPLVEEDASGYPVVAVLGPRQSGKTTLVRSLFPECAYTNLEDPATRQFAQEDPRGFLGQGHGRMIIDEFQRVPELLSYIQTDVDQTSAPGRFILTGSQNYLMMEGISQSLAGRIGLVTLLPLSLAELVRSGEEVPELNPLLFTGLYPRLYSASLDPGRFYDNYVQTYLERDIRLLKNVTDLAVFHRFLQLCAGRVGQVVNFSSLADDAGISHNTARAWLGLLQTSYAVRPLTPYYRNFNKQIIKSPKLYFTDTGLLCSLLEIATPDQLTHHYLRGGIFENLVVTEFDKAQANAGRRRMLHFWRERRGREVDLLIDRGTERVAVEAKAGHTISGDYFAGLSYYGELDAGCPPSNRYLIYAGEESQDRSAARVRPWRALANLPDDIVRRNGVVEAGETGQ